MADQQHSREDEALRAIFSRHGYGFQYAVAKQCVDQHHKRASHWQLDATEFPVEVNGTHLHVDIILRSGRGLMIIECKRANPALALWCFGRSTFSSEDMSEQSFVRLDQAEWDRKIGCLLVRQGEPDHTDHQYHVALEAPTTQPGDPSGSRRGALNEAVSQALRGSSGLINTLNSRTDGALLGPDGHKKIIPVVVTTARLFACSHDLAVSDLESGRLPDDATASERRWIWFRINVTAQLRYGAQRLRAKSYAQQKLDTFGELADADYSQSVAIVSASGLTEFLTVASRHIGEW
ncbi:MAG TPA: hypothetical protein VI485_21530 [Vicinamibacterales bacterium]|nr:hypothetical protein [Vicinamibacterales bacterium]